MGIWLGVFLWIKLTIENNLFYQLDNLKYHGYYNFTIILFMKTWADPTENSYSLAKKLIFFKAFLKVDLMDKNNF